MLRAAFLALAVATATAQKVLQAGDSWTAFAGTTLNTYCSGVTTTNKGTSSSTAQQWAAGSCPDLGDDGACSFATAFTAGSGFSHIVISVGGNDYLDTAGCAMSKATVTERVKASIEAAKSAGPAGIKVIVIGYCSPTQAVADCSSPTAIQDINGGIKDAASATGATFLDGTSVCGGSPTSFSPGTHHQDSIHLNAKGYCEFWTMPASQTALGCAAKTYDCGSVAGTAVAGTEGEAKGHAGGESESEGAGEMEGEGEGEAEGLGAGAYAGIAVGAVAGLGLIGYAAFKMCGKTSKGGAPSSGGAGDVELKVVDGSRA